MTYIVSYQKFIDSHRSVEITLPVDSETNQRIGDELATIDGVTYVAIPTGIDLPEQPLVITVTPVTLTADQKILIAAASPLVRVINDQVKESIAAKYSITDELRLIRTQPSADFTAYDAYVESCRAVGRSKKSALGL
ncbi:hypothetical protein UFOVP14_27 [uncultured Caudovirales phage]|uniref:Uncharacterized protein n=1 Tax=uncultured Caudovirales phage TaxID=2100421 RepID=A0A6J5KJ44_9CAUD|nr:hypothetical protein UFOVP14_27 [uncultured Caudovirales phage]